MKLQSKILYLNFKKALKWYVLLLVLIVINIIYFKVRPGGRSLNLNDFLSLLTLPKINDTYSLTLLGIYQIGLHIYFGYMFFTYEISEHFSYMVGRIVEKKWFINKIFVLFLYLVIFLLTEWIILYIFFNNYIKLEIIYFIMSFLYLYVILLFMIFILYKMPSIISYIFLILFIIFSYFMSAFCHLLLITFIIIYLIFCFKMKKLCIKFEKINK